MLDGIPIHEAFDSQAKLHPQRLAVICDNHSLNYSDLQEISFRISATILNAGVEIGSLVGLMLPRSELFIAAVLGILRAGSCVVPLDPHYPIERIRRMVEHAPIELLISDDEHVNLSLNIQNKLVIPDRLDPWDTRLIWPKRSRDDLAFVFFTSGSTGQPKGVLMTHGARIASIRWLIENYGEPKSHLFRSAVSHNPMVREIFWPLLSGGVVVVAPKETHKEPTYLLELINNHQIDVVGFTPSMLKAFLEAIDASAIKRNLIVICGGETIESKTVQQFFERLPQSKLLRFYGLTEAGMALHVDLRPDLDPASLGYTTYLQVRILDQDLNEAEYGIEGEIFLSGEGLSKGYLLNKELTASRFIRDPLNPHSILFRTGDRAIRRPNNEFIYVGRTDRMVKISGVRIELSDVESAMLRFSGVSTAIAIAIQSLGQELEIHGFIVFSYKTLSESEFKNELCRFLPRTMIPKKIHILTNIPLLPNGKTDINSLKQLAYDSFLNNTTQNEILPKIFVDAFPHRFNSLRQRFFSDLGGDSLLALEIITKIQLNFKIEIPTELFAGDPSIAEIISFMEQSQFLSSVRTDEDYSLGDSDQNEDKNYLFTLTQRDASRQKSYSYYGSWLLVGEFDAPSFDYALNECLAASNLRKVKADFESEKILLMPFDHDSLFEHIVLDGSNNERLIASQLLATDPKWINHEVDRPLKATVIQIDDSKNILTFAFSMIFFDGYSIRLFIKELEKLYNKDSIKYQSGPNRVNRHNFFDYANWEVRHYGTVSELLNQCSTELIALTTQSLLQSTEKKYKKRGTNHISTRRATLKAETCSCIDDVATACGVSPNRVLLGIMALALAKVKNSENVVLDVMSSNRNVSGTQDMIGPLTVRVPLFFQFTEPGREQVIKSIQVATSRLLVQQPALGSLQSLLESHLVARSRILVSEIVGGLEKISLNGCTSSRLGSARIDGFDQIAIDSFTDMMIRFRRKQDKYDLTLIMRNQSFSITETDQFFNNLDHLASWLRRTPLSLDFT